MIKIFIFTVCISTCIIGTSAFIVSHGSVNGSSSGHAKTSVNGKTHFHFAINLESEALTELENLFQTAYQAFFKLIGTFPNDVEAEIQSTINVFLDAGESVFVLVRDTVINTAKEFLSMAGELVTRLQIVVTKGEKLIADLMGGGHIVLAFPVVAVTTIFRTLLSLVTSATIELSAGAGGSAQGSGGARFNHSYAIGG